MATENSELIKRDLLLTGVTNRGKEGDVVSLYEVELAAPKPMAEASYHGGDMMTIWFKTIGNAKSVTPMRRGKDEVKVMQKLQVPCQNSGKLLREPFGGGLRRRIVRQ